MNNPLKSMKKSTVYIIGGHPSLDRPHWETVRDSAAAHVHPLLSPASANERNLGWASLYIVIQTTWKDGASLCSNRSITLISYGNGEEDHSSGHSWSPVGCRIRATVWGLRGMTIHEPDLAIPLWPKPKQPSSVCLIFQLRFWRESPYNDKHFKGQNSVGGVT